jgi:histidine triad (HIT) family protein
MQQDIAAQKEACPFCQIALGKIPAQCIYQDDLCMAILDIHPATKGHVLLFPKDHILFFPLIPQATRLHLAKIYKYIIQAQKKAFACASTTLYIANGAVAGQQVGHAILHIIPREPQDGLAQFTPKEIQVDSKELEAFASQIGPILSTQLDAAYEQKRAIGALLEADPALLELVTHKPLVFIELMQKDPRLSELFKGIDIAQLSTRLKEGR